MKTKSISIILIVIVLLAAVVVAICQIVDVVIAILVQQTGLQLY